MALLCVVILQGTSKNNVKGNNILSINIMKRPLVLNIMMPACQEALCL